MGEESFRLEILIHRGVIMKLNLAQRTLLRECIEAHAPHLEMLLGRAFGEGLTDHEREHLREAVAAELTTTGLDSNDALNSRGAVLDDLIGALANV